MACCQTFSIVGRIIEQNTPGHLAIAPSPAYLLVVVDGRPWNLVMNDKAQVWFVDAHAKRIGRTHYLVLVGHQFLLGFLAHMLFPARVIVFSLYTLLAQKCR
jgi:hypothetical protein